MYDLKKVGRYINYYCIDDKVSVHSCCKLIHESNAIGIYFIWYCDYILIQATRRLSCVTLWTAMIACV